MKAVAEDLFAGLNQEEEQERQDFKVERNSVLEQVIKGYERCLQIKREHCMNVVDKIVPQGVSREIIDTFFSLLPAYKNFFQFQLNTGVYMSHLINNSPDDDFDLDLTHIEPTCYFGWKLKDKSLTLRGVLNLSTGYKMESGKLFLIGSSIEGIGDEMSGGAITILGDADHLGWAMIGGRILCEGRVGWVGNNMEGGRLSVHGSARVVGDGMSGGKIHIYGNTKSVGAHMSGGIIHVDGGLEFLDENGLTEDMRGGDIYHKGELIVKDGVRIK